MSAARSIPAPAGPRAPGGPSPRRRTMIRLVLAPVLLGVVLGVLALHDRTGNPLPSDLLLLVFGGAAALEMARMLSGSTRAPDVLLPVLFAALLSGIGLLAPDDPFARGAWRGVLVAGAFCAVLLRHVYDTRASAVESIALSMLPVLYVGLLFSFTREVATGDEGARRLAWVIVTSKASDMGGWLVGKPFGRHKMIPAVSPGKSWEGLAGGLAASVLCAVLLPPALGLSEASWGGGRLVFFGLAVGGASVVAGITQSGWKRRLGVKDSSRLIPEMGGVLDMVDSLLLAGPVACVLLA